MDRWIDVIYKIIVVGAFKDYICVLNYESKIGKMKGFKMIYDRDTNSVLRKEVKW